MGGRTPRVEGRPEPRVSSPASSVSEPDLGRAVIARVISSSSTLSTDVVITVTHDNNNQGDKLWPWPVHRSVQLTNYENKHHF